VLTGKMSLVGPRPLLMEYLDLYTPTQARRHEVRPGITGWAQVNGRNTADWADRLTMDTWYVDHPSLALDVRVLLRTVAQAVRGHDVRAEGQATVGRFEG
jgi:sugar transferase EpsL